jgi:hypothetical protein
MEDFAVNVLWMTSLALPGLLFAAANRFKSRLATAVVALLAIGAGWTFMLAYAVAAQSLTSKDPTQVNGAALAFAATFGWVLPAAIVIGTWIFCGYVTRRMGPNNSFKPNPHQGGA